MPANRTIVATVVLVLVGDSLGGQVRLRYTPLVGSTYYMHVWTEASTSLTGEAVGGTGSVLELDARESTTRRVALSNEQGFEITVVRDSARSRLRRGDGAWQEVIDPPHTSWPVTVIVDDRLAVSAVRSQTPSGVQLHRGLAGGLEAELPDETLQPSQTWEATLGVRLVRHLIPDDVASVAEARLDERLSAAATMTLDSIFVRAGDTLAFITYEGTVTPVARTVPSDVATSLVSVGGTVAGTLVWSTGWDAYVSGSSRTQVRVRVQVVVFGEEPTDILAMDTNIASRFTVRP